MHGVRALRERFPGVPIVADLKTMGFGIDALIPQSRTGSQEARYKLRRDDSEIGIEDLRGLLNAVRKAGEKGLTVTRFKGLGEMMPSQLKETTMDPMRRTLLKVVIPDQGRPAADESVEQLMGNKPEARFAFIQERAAFATELVDL